MSSLSPLTLSELESFGGVAAEDDAVLDYFLQTDAVADIKQGKAFLVLGRKGAGKTAIVRHFTEGNPEVRSRALNLRGYPWNIHSQWIDRGASDMEAYVSSWRYVIAIEIATMVASDAERTQHDKVCELKKFLEDNYGGATPDLQSIIRPKRLKLNRLSFQPAVFGNQLGGIEVERTTGDLNLGLELNALSAAILQNCKAIISNEGLGPYVLHFDELDQGLSALDDTRSKLLIGLLLAARDIRIELAKEHIPVLPVVYLRTDLWDELEFSDKNKINQTQTLRLEWSSGALKELVNIRLKAKLDPKAEWDGIIDSGLMRGSQAKWDHIVARTFLRPRDVIKFLNSALATAKARNEEPIIFSNEDIVNSRAAYSAYLKEELDDEILPHWGKWDEALQACSAISTVTFDRSLFEKEYAARKSKDNQAEADQALEMLFRFSVIGYSTRSGYGGSSWTFQYVEPQAGWDNGATRFKVHPGLKEYAKLREERR